MSIVAMRRCVRCGIAFHAVFIEQMCCSDVCSDLLQKAPTSTTTLARVALPAIPDRRQYLTPRPKSGRRPPIFVGQRFVVFEWQIEQLARMLGPHIDDFDLHEWFFTLDARVATSSEIVPQRDGGQWLQARTLEEAQQRGLVAASNEPPASQHGKQTSRLAQALANIKRGLQS